MSNLPPHVLAECQRILDGAARRLLAEERERDSGSTMPPQVRDEVQRIADRGARRKLMERLNREEAD